MSGNWLAIESVATACSTGFTAVMAGMTWRAIADSRTHHKDEYRPILVLAPEDGVEPPRRDTVIRSEKSSIDGGPGYSLVGVTLRNIGRGPALNWRITIRFQGIEDYGVTRGLSPVQAGSEYETGGRVLCIPVSFVPSFNETDFQAAPAAGWQIFLEYEDLFGQLFHTIHRSDARVPWTALGQGRIPKGVSTESQSQRLAQSIPAIRPKGVDAL